MKITRIILILLFFSSIDLCAQNQQRLEDLKSILSTMADSIPGLSANANLSIADAPLRELFRALAETHQLNISLNRIPNVTVYNNFNDVKVSDLIAFLCFEYQLDVKLINNILLISRFLEIPVIDFTYDSLTNKLSFSFSNDTLSKVAATLTANTKYNVVASPNIRNVPVSGFINNLPFDVALEQLAIANDLEVSKTGENVFLLSYVPPQVVERQGVTGNTRIASNRRNTRNGNFTYSIKEFLDDKFLTINATGAKASEIISQISRELNIGHVFLNEPDGSLDCYLSEVTYEAFLKIALATTSQPFSYTKTNNLYLIGDEKNTAMSKTFVYRFKNRSVEDVSAIIPVQLSSQLEIGEFMDLNALILTGSQNNIDILKDFLEDIDKPVPNILIEVMVVEVRKGYTMNTGIKAGLSDSVPPSAGSIFPGVDISLNSSSMNNFLEKIDRLGVINLGQVTPQFYATIQALENNNNINLRSTPKLSALNGNEASLKIGQSVYYRVETQNVSSGLNPIITRSPQYEKVEANLEIKIKPFVSFNEYVTLTIESEFSDFIDPTVEGAPPGNATREFISKIRIRNEEMIVLGGLEEASKSESGSGIPGLSRVPILKWFFSSKSKDEANRKLLIFIKPTIVY